MPLRRAQRPAPGPPPLPLKRSRAPAGFGPLQHRTNGAAAGPCAGGSRLRPGFSTRARLRGPPRGRRPRRSPRPPGRPDPPGAETCASRSGGRLRPPLSRATCASRRARGRPGSAQAPRRQPDRTVLELSGAPPGRGHDPHPSADSDPPPHPGRSAQRTVVTDSRRISEAGTRCEAGRPPSIVSQIISTARAAWRSGCWVMTVSRGSRRLKTSRSS